MNECSIRRLPAELSGNRYRRRARYAMHERPQTQIACMTESADHDWSQKSAAAESQCCGFGEVRNLAGRAAAIIWLDGGNS